MAPSYDPIPLSGSTLYISEILVRVAVDLWVFFFFFLILLFFPPRYLPICHKINHFLIQRAESYATVRTTTTIHLDKCSILCIPQHGQLGNY
jgi:hypothetical protein